MSTEIFVAIVFLFFAWLVINQSYKLGSSIVEFLLELEKYTIVRKDAPTPTPEEKII